MLHRLSSDVPGLKYGVLSNACGAYVRAVLNVTGLYSLFDVALGADDVPAAKPAPDGLLQCCQFLGTSPEACVYVGDSPSDGIAAASAGMRSVGVTWGSNSRESVSADFDETVDSVAELEASLRALCAKIQASAPV